MLKKFKLGANNLVSNYKKSLSERRSQSKLTMCKKCYTFYYRNSWHFEIPRFLTNEREKEIPVLLLFSQCPPCLEEENVFYENETNLTFGKMAM